MNLYQPTISGSLTVSGSVIVDGTIVMTSGSISGTASLAENSLLLNNLNSGSFVGTGSYNTFSGSVSSRLVTQENASASFAAQSSSLSTRVTNLEVTTSVVSSSFATTSGSLSERVTIIEGQDATTGSNTFTGVQYVSQASNAISFTSTASLYTDGGLRVAKDSFVSGTAYFNNITVYGTSSIEYITSSQVNIGSNIITVNTDTPAVRFGGLSVFDSGSTQLTGSIFWDSEKNHWIYSNPSGSSYNSAMLMNGPRNTGSLGDEQGTTSNALMKGQGGDHITSSQVIDDGTTVRIPGNLQVTGSILSNGGIGIGTSAVTSGYSLDVNGTSYFRSTTVITGSGGTYLNIRNSGGSDSAVFVFDGTNTGYVGLNVGSNPNKFVIYYAADTRMAIDTSGRVGFGTGTPSYNLEISSGSSAPTELAVVNTNAAGAARLSLRNTERDFIITSNTADDLLSFAYGGSNRLQFHTSSQWFNSGNVGIGTSSPGEQLTLSRSTYPTVKLIETTDNFSGYLQYHSEANEFRLLTITNHPLIFSTYDTEKMRIAAGGNVGIGTNNPSYLLHLQQATGNTAIFMKRVTNDTNFEISVQESRTRLRTWSTANDRDFFFDTDNTGTTRMTITGAGRVGIGVTNPDAGLQVAQVGQDDQLTLGSAANNRDHAAFIYSGGNKAEFLRYQSGVRLVIASSSNITNVDIVPGGSVGVRLSAGNTSWSAYTSDERKKKNFETVPGLEAVMQINPVKYHFKTQEDSEIKKLGFIAQNIQPLVPEMVHPNGEKAEDGTDILTIIPDYILPVLVKAIQELKAEINELKNK